MTHVSPTVPRRLPVLSIEFQTRPENPDWPEVLLLVDGADPFRQVAPNWHGLGPETLLGCHSPLLPDDFGRRVTVRVCSCGSGGCGAIAPVIFPSPNGRIVSWIDFIDRTGPFGGPPPTTEVLLAQRKWTLPDLHFDRDQYTAEIERAGADDSWEVPRRRTARLLYEQLAPLSLTLPPGRPLRSSSVAWTLDGVTLLFDRRPGADVPIHDQQLLLLNSTCADPAAAAADMAAQLLSVRPSQWVSTFGWHPVRVGRAVHRRTVG